MRYQNAVAFASLILVGCRLPDVASSDETNISTPVLFGKSTPAAEPRAHYSFADSVDVGLEGSPSWTPAGIRGDGRMRNGNAAGVAGLSNEYQGDFCGVYGVLETQGPGGQTTLVFNTDPDINWRTTMTAACGAARKFAFYLNGTGQPATQLGPHSVIDSIGVLSAGQVGARMVRFGVQMADCPGIRFGAYAGTNMARVTRLPDVPSETGTARQWLVESQGSHRGICGSPTKNGGFLANGRSYYLPFVLTITEVLQPAAGFP